jgi:hypothetical protein
MLGDVPEVSSFPGTPVDGWTLAGTSRFDWALRIRALPLSRSSDTTGVLIWSVMA